MRNKRLLYTLINFLCPLFTFDWSLSTVQFGQKLRNKGVFVYTALRNDICPLLKLSKRNGEIVSWVFFVGRFYTGLRCGWGGEVEISQRSPLPQLQKPSNLKNTIYGIFIFESISFYFAISRIVEITNLDLSGSYFSLSLFHPFVLWWKKVKEKSFSSQWYRFRVFNPTPLRGSTTKINIL